MNTCKTPPEGWYCTREGGHRGPCAAYPDGFDDTNINLLFTCGTFDPDTCISTDDICKLLDKPDNWQEWITSQIKQEGIEKYLEWYDRMFERGAVCEGLQEAHTEVFGEEIVIKNSYSEWDEVVASLTYSRERLELIYKCMKPVKESK